MGREPGEEYSIRVSLSESAYPSQLIRQTTGRGTQYPSQPIRVSLSESAYPAADRARSGHAVSESACPSQLIRVTVSGRRDQEPDRASPAGGGGRTRV